MEAGPRETEVKLRVPDRAAFEARLRALGATAGPVEDEVNLLLDDDAGSLRLCGTVLRVRSVDGRGLLTFKGPASYDGGVKSRLELETGVDETPLGLFAEIEGETDAVRALAAELEVAESAFLRASYWGLWLAAREGDPDLPEDMVFPG